jgi:DNA adenine methylase
MKTFIRRPGNKTNHLKHIIPLLPKEYNTYIEPFLGTGAVFLHLLPSQWVINDLNKNIYGIWETVRENPEKLLKEIEAFKKKVYSLDNQKRLEYCKKNIDKASNSISMYLILSYCCFDGIIEKNNNFNIFSLYSHFYNSNMPHIFKETYKTKIIELSKILKNGLIYNEDYSVVLEKAKKGDFVFLDPPYIENKTYVFNYIQNNTFDIYKLKEQVLKLDKNQVKWMMTQIDTPQTRELFKKYRIISYINKNSFGGNREKKEIIIMNY